MWHQEARWRARLLAEVGVMNERFPTFALMRASSGDLYWEGFLEPVSRRRFLARVTYPSRYPYQEPKLRVMQPSIQRGAPHLYLSGELCIHRRSWNPQTGTAASCVPLVAAWLVGYLRWRQTGEGF